jgi:protein subunit release factor B
LTKKDFKLEWFSGTGAGGQHRNKHQNCCRITHIETGLKAQGTSCRDRVSNQRIAFNNLAKMVISNYYAEDDAVRFKATDVVRNYHAVRNEVHDKNSGFKQEYKKVLGNDGLGEMINSNLLSRTID